MKRNFRFAAVALTAMALMAACNNNAPEEVALDTLPAVDTTVVEEVIDTVIEEAPVEEAQPVKAVKKAVKKEAQKAEKTVKAAGANVKKDVQTVSNELKKGEGNSVNVQNTGAKQNMDPLGTKKKPASEVTGFTKH
jgi:hypothetical protein